MALGKIKADTLEHSTAGSLDTQYIVNGSAKVWGLTTSAAAITASLNLSSGTDNGTGDYSYSLSSAFGSANFAMTATSSGTGAGKICTSNTGRKTASVVAIEIENHDGSANDQNQELNAHGDLA